VLSVGFLSQKEDVEWCFELYRGRGRIRDIVRVLGRAIEWILEVRVVEDG